MIKLLKIMSLLAVGLLAACGTPSQNQTAQEQAAVSAAGPSQAVITRRTGFTGSIVPVLVELNGEQVASIAANGTEIFEVPPGTHVLRVTSGLAAPAELTFTKMNDQPVFFNVSLRQGVLGTSLEIVQVVRS